MDLSLILPAFLAGILTFLAPCTLPLVPGYLGFISGASIDDLKDPAKKNSVRRKVFINGLFYVIGFTIIFILLGTVFGILGAALVDFRIWLTRIGGVFVIFFGLYLMHVFKLPFFNFMNRTKKFNLVGKLTPGTPVSSLIFGGSFAFGWTPCVGPVLGTILVLASTSGSIFQGAFLLFIFSVGLAIPFLLVALGYGHAAQRIQKISKYLNIISLIGGLFLVMIGYLLLIDRLGLWISFFFQLFGEFGYEHLLDYL